MAETHDIIEQIRGATVWVADAPPPDGTLHGTGFFVAPGFAVTCGHVLVAAGPTPHLWWGGGGHAVLEHRMSPEDPQVALAGMTWPDAAVMRVELTDHPVVPLGEAAMNHDVWCYGTTRARTGRDGRPEPDGRRLKVTLVGTDGFLQLVSGRLLRGMSGGPVLDLTQFTVVGMTQSSADEKTDAGGYATPIGAALELWTAADLAEANAGVDRVSIKALRRDQGALGTLPKLVEDRLTHASGPLTTYFATYLQLEPSKIPQGERAEWVARQLFRLNLPQLVKALKNTIRDDFEEDAKTVFSFVAPCLPAGIGADSHWVFPDMAADVRAELADETPRIVHLGTDQETSATVLLQRALAEVVAMKRCGSASGATSAPGGVPSQQRDDIEAVICESLGATRSEWAESPEEIAFYYREMGTIVDVDPGPEPDANVLIGLRTTFPGLRMVVSRRDFTVPAGAESEVHSAAPPFDERNERGALRVVLELNTALTARNVLPFPVRGKT